MSASFGDPRLPQSFWDRVELIPFTTCWIWTGGTTSRDGHGRLQVNKRAIVAHRLTYETFIGPVPSGLVLDHFRCDTPPCVHPEHVRPVTNRENSLRATTGPIIENVSRSRCARGHEYRFTPSGGRECRECNKLAVVKHHEKLRVAAGRPHWKTVLHRCVFCAADFTPRHQASRFCSDRCLLARQAEQDAEYRSKNLQRVRERNRLWAAEDRRRKREGGAL